MTLEELRRLAESRSTWPHLSGYEIYYGLVEGSGRCLTDPRYLSEAEQEQGQPATAHDVLREIDTALEQRTKGRRQRWT